VKLIPGIGMLLSVIMGEKPWKQYRFVKTAIIPEKIMFNDISQVKADR
jgi:hypothetical protein